ncbi:MAG: cation transporter [Magnetococcales bacterium]|nr:cation transporter [Magnetococcales bacterium]
MAGYQTGMTPPDDMPPFPHTGDAAVADQEPEPSSAAEEALPPFWLEPSRTVLAACQACRMQAVWWDLLIALGDAVFMTLMGWITGSMALHAQGLQSLGDFFNKGVTLISVKTAAKPPSRRFPYGFGKIQFLSAAFVGSSLFLGSLAFIYGNLRHINQGLFSAPSYVALLGPLLSMAASFIMYRYLTCVSEQNNNLALTAAALDNRQDLFATGALLLGVLFSILGWPVADHAAAILVSLFTVQIGFSIASRAVHGLLDGTIPDRVLRQIRAVTLQVPGVLGVTRLRGRMLGESWEVDLQILVDGLLPTGDTHQTAQSVRQAILQQVKYTESVHISILPQ